MSSMNLKHIAVLNLLLMFHICAFAQLKHNGHAYVDLGLSVKWATCNIGASSPEGRGNYYAWGETKPKSRYDWTTYKWCKGRENTLTKYNKQKENGVVDKKSRLALSDDAAHVNWGGKWRIPTDEEVYELSEKCTWTLVKQKGVYGYKIKSKINGKSIFLPAVGFKNESRLEDFGMMCVYWTSTLDQYDSHVALPLYSYVMELSDDGIEYDYWSRRCHGHTVRPVCP